ncbi:MAG: hypothetical protein KTR28_03280 [Micavibrio sp.]|nr:hypothetical protein [Micavibrio sp.]
MRFVLPLIIVMIPALIALGHDGYLFYMEHMNPGRFNMQLLQDKFKFSSLGYIWTTYDVESYKTTRESLSDEDWAELDTILTFKAFYVGLGFAAVMMFILGLFALFGKGPLSKREKGGVKVKNRNKKAYKIT